MNRRITTFRTLVSLWMPIAIGVGAARAADISGTIAATLKITDNSRLVGDVTCTVTGAACISIGAPNITLDLNGFTVSGQADPQTACSGGATAGEVGVAVISQTGVVIRGPGVIQRFRNFGIMLSTVMGSSIKSVTTSTNCASGIIVIGGSLNDLSDNISIANGSSSNPCGGI